MKFLFCPKCGSQLTLEKNDHDTVPVCQNKECRFFFWQHSKPCVCIVIPDDHGRVLMTIRGRDPEIGKLDLPGGFLQEGEHPDDGAKRETLEEIGVEIHIEGYLGFVIDGYGTANDRDHTLNIGVLAKIVNGTPYVVSEIAAIEWVDPKTVDTKQLAFINNEIFLKRFLDVTKKN